jgi:hypothetical protein
MRSLISLIFVTSIYISCKVPVTPSAAKNDKVVRGTISYSQFRLASQELQSILGQNLKETLFIKYDVVKDDCDRFSERMADDVIANFVRQDIAAIQKISTNYTNVTAVHLRETGTNFSRFVKWNDSIRVDKNGSIFKSLFQGRYTCGSTIIVFPDKTFVLVNSDNKFAALQFL